MTTFDDRTKAYEDKFAHDNELAFKITARRNHLFGLWAAGRLHLAADEVNQYADAIVQMGLDKKDSNKLIQKVQSDFAKVDVTYSTEDLNDMLEEFEHTAKQQLLGE